MAQIAKIFAGRAQNILQAAAKQPQLPPRFYSAAGKYIMIDFFIRIWNWIFFVYNQQVVMPYLLYFAKQIFNKLKCNFKRN